MSPQTPFASQFWAMMARASTSTPHSHPASGRGIWAPGLLPQTQMKGQRPSQIMTVQSFSRKMGVALPGISLLPWMKSFSRTMRRAILMLPPPPPRSLPEEYKPVRWDPPRPPLMADGTSGEFYMSGLPAGTYEFALLATPTHPGVTCSTGI
jgi:hypothetical protein